MNNQSTEVPSSPKVYSYRYVCLVLFFLTALVNSFAPNTFVATAVTARNIYDESNFIINLNSLAYTIMHPLVLFPANYILDQVGLKVGLNIACGFMILGYGLKLLINIHFWIFVVGTFVTGFGFIFLLNSPTKFISTWFPTAQIPVANGIVMFALFASDALGVFVPVLFVDQNSTKDDMFQMILIEACIVIGLHLLMLFFFRGKPPTPANFSSTAKKEKYVQSLKNLVGNKNYVIIFFSVMFIWGVISAFFVTISWQMTAYGYTDQQIGLFVVSSNACGIFGVVLAGSYLQKTKKYKKTCIFCAFGGFICFILLMISLEVIQNPFPLYILSAGTGFFLFPYMTTITELATETAFPVGQATSGGTILAGGQLFGFILGITLQFLFDGADKNLSRIGSGIYLFFTLIGACCLFKVKQDLRKNKYQIEQAQKSLLSKNLLSSNDDLQGAIN